MGRRAQERLKGVLFCRSNRFFFVFSLMFVAFVLGIGRHSDSLSTKYKLIILNWISPGISAVLQQHRGHPVVVVGGGDVQGRAVLDVPGLKKKRKNRRDAFTISNRQRAMAWYDAEPIFVKSLFDFSASKKFTSPATMLLACR